MKQITIFFFLFIFTSNSFAQKNLDVLLKIYNNSSIPYISVEETRMLQVNGSVVILDAREPEEFTVSHLKTAINIGFKDFSSEANAIQNLNKNTPIIIYCSVGIRSEKMGEKLKKSGFINVKNLYGGIFEWKNKGYPVVDSTNTETENVHAFSKVWSKWLHKGTPIY